ncbi:MAG: flagellar biosynthesis protein FlhB [Alphaproteobacteria bacterium]|nr:flagellar biosynthesis protein FlhB [Alphaproteobacteria bacterium]
MSDDSEKTEEPTDKKLSEAKDEGQVARSMEVNHWFILLAALMFIGLMGKSFALTVYNTFESFISRPDLIPTGVGGIGGALGDSVMAIFLAMLLPWLLFVVAAIAPGLLQNGLNFSPKAIAPKLDKINPISGVKRMFSLTQIMEFLKGLVKIVLVAVVLVVAVLPELDSVELLLEKSPIAVLDEVFWLTILIVGLTLFLMTIIAAADFAYQKWNFLKQQRMSKQEVKDENRQAEGDPLVKGRLRQIRMERSRRRMMAAVPDATVVVTNPTHFSVALKYDRQSMPAPMVVAKGHDDLALRIREMAKEHDVPVVENPPVARALYASVEVDEEIKPEHFQAVAEIISFVFRLGGGAKPTRH